MDLANRLTQIADRLEDIRPQIQTEEATKTALVLPFIRALGYDVFNPSEVVPEFVADVGIKKGEKVDYAICRDRQPIILFECKPLGAKLDHYSSQLYRYFSVTSARIAILTDGVFYRFYSDLIAPNKLDERPFLSLDITNPSPDSLREVAKLSHSEFDLDTILASAEEMKYSGEIKRRFADLIREPTPEFVRLLADPVYEGRWTQGVHNRFEPLVVRALRNHVSELVDQRLENALAHNRGNAPAIPADDAPLASDPPAEEGDRIETTVEELQGLYAVKAILRDQVEPSRIVDRDVKSYFGILLDNNNRKPICRLWFNAKQKYIGVFDKDKNETRIPITSIDEIFQHADKLRASLSHVNQESD